MLCKYRATHALVNKLRENILNQVQSLSGCIFICKFQHFQKNIYILRCATCIGGIFCSFPVFKLLHIFIAFQLTELRDFLFLNQGESSILLFYLYFITLTFLFFIFKFCQLQLPFITTVYIGILLFIAATDNFFIYLASFILLLLSLFFQIHFLASLKE